MTPGQFFALTDRRDYDLYRNDFRAGIIAVTVYNTHKGKNSPDLEVTDFMPKTSRTAEAAAEEQTPEQLLAKFQGLFGGKIGKG